MRIVPRLVMGLQSPTILTMLFIDVSKTSDVNVDISVLL